MSLTIEAGCQVLFFGYYKFIVDEGAILTAVGTQAEMIVFDEYFSGNYWHGIRLLKAAATTTLAYCHFNHGKATGTGDDAYGGAIFCSSSKPQIAFCLFENTSASQGGVIYCGGNSDPSIIENTFTSNSNKVIYCTQSNPTISENTFTSNSNNVIYCTQSNPAISENTFTSNSINVINCTQSNPTISENTFTSNSNRVIYLGANSDATISGNMFTSNSVSGSYGSAIYCDANSDATISENTFASNAGSAGGGAIYCRESSQIISGNTFMSNSGGAGGAILLDYCTGPCPTTISGNTFMFNSGSVGGAICCSNSSAIISENTFTSNSAGSSNGGAIYCGGSSQTISGNTFTLNIVSSNGGAVYLDSCLTNLTNNTFCMNTASIGGGIYAYSLGVTTTIINNTFYANSAASSGAGIYCDQSSPAITNTILWGDTAPAFAEINLYGGSAPTVTYCDVMGGWPGSGNIDADPIFSDGANNDLHLTWNSPCNNTGTNAAQGLPDEDFEGDPRIANGTVDMGADEFYRQFYISGDKTPGGGIEGKLVGLPGTNPLAIIFGSGVLETPFNTMWGPYWLQAPWLLVPLIPLQIPADGILVIPATIPLDPAAPYDLPMQALIGLNPDSMSNLEMLQVR